MDYSKKQANGKTLPAKRDKEEQKPEFGEDQTPWGEMTCGEQLKTVVWVCVRIALLLGCLYFFICSLGLLEDSFQLLGGKAAGKTFQNNELIQNPVAGLMIGVLATVLVQSSSTSTSIIITMVGSGFIEIDEAIPIIMGANIGTSVTNTLVSLAQAADRVEFRRAFAGATVHDMFNWLTVLVLLPLERVCNYLRRLTGAIVNTLPDGNGTNAAPDMLKAITKPFTQLIVQVDKHVIEKTASAGRNNTEEPDGNVLKRWCKEDVNLQNVTHTRVNVTSLDCDAVLASGAAGSAPWLTQLCEEVRRHPLVDPGHVDLKLSWDSLESENVTTPVARCGNLFAQSDLSDTASGAILLVCSLLVIFLALYGIVKILHSLLHGSLANVVKKTINADLPGKAAYFTGYIAILVGCGMTVILQSSSVFTSTLTPLVGVGVVTVERMYPLTLGSNVGTTVTGILAALSQSGDHLRNSLQVALCHLFFNISGIMLFYPIPFMRWPIGMAKTLGRTTAKHRWFAVVYIIVLFIVFPAIIFGLSIAGDAYLGAIGGTMLFTFLALLFINVLQRKKPGCLPRGLRNWNFLPHWMHSLKPVDHLIASMCRCGCCQKLQEADLGEATIDDVEIVVGGSDDHSTVANSHADVEQNVHSTVVTKTGDYGAVKENRGAAAYDNKGFQVEEHRL